MDKSHQILTTDEIAHYLRTTPSWVREQCRKNQIPFVKIGREYRFIQSDVDTWLMSQQHRF